jgi:hypothetical protein
MRFVLTKVRLHHGHLLARDLRAVLDRAHAAIVGGSRISIAQAPWQVVVIAVLSETEGLLCGGAILNRTEVLTAGHCVYSPETRKRIPADQIVVGAGTADFFEEPEQVSLASGVRVHPYYVYNPEATQAAPDDVSVLELEKPLAFGTDVKAISLVSGGSLLQEGTPVNLTGFGEENPLIEELDGELHSIGMTLGFSRECGGEANALFLCASTPTGSDCFGDSGSALTELGSPATLVGVTDTTEVIDGVPCADGSVGGFANVAAPEIRDFIVEDALQPPRAPQGGGVSVHGVSMVGDTLTCEPGAWSNDPTFTYAFVNSADEQVLQQGSSSTYALTSADIGRTILCQVLAANAGGTGIGRTLALAAVRPSVQEEEAATRKRQEEEAAAKKRQGEEAAKGGVLGVKESAPGVEAKEGSPDATIADTSLTESSSGVVSLKISCPAGESSCAGTVTLRTLNAVSASMASSAKTKATVVTLATGSFTVAGGEVKTVTLHLSAKARALLARSHILRVRATIVAHDPTGETHTKQVIVTLHAAKVKHGKG